MLTSLTGCEDVDFLIYKDKWRMEHIKTFQPCLSELKYCINVARSVALGKAIHTRNFKKDFFPDYFTPAFVSYQINFCTQLCKSQDDSLLIELSSRNEYFRDIRKEEIAKMRF